MKKVDFSGKNFHEQLCPLFLKNVGRSPSRGDYTPTTSPIYPL